MNSANIIPLDENFNIGLSKVDDQHRKLVQLANLLASRVAFKPDIPQQNIIMGELPDYTVYRCQTEEAIWYEYLPEDGSELKHKETFVQISFRIGSVKVSA